jgi:hypothetical protein
MIDIPQHYAPKYVDSSPDMLTQAVKFLTSIRQVTGSIPGRHVAYPDILHGLPEPPQANYGNYHQIGHGRFLAHSFRVITHQSS